MQFGWSLTLIFDARGERALEAIGCFDDVLGNLASNDPILRRAPHLELASCPPHSGDTLKIGEEHKIAFVNPPSAHTRQGRRFHPADAHHPPSPSPRDDGCSPGDRKV